MDRSTDKMKELRITIVGDRFFYKYDVMIEPIKLNNQRINIFRKFIFQLNDILR